MTCMLKCLGVNCTDDDSFFVMHQKIKWTGRKTKKKKLGEKILPISYFNVMWPQEYKLTYMLQIVLLN